MTGRDGAVAVGANRTSMRRKDGGGAVTRFLTGESGVPVNVPVEIVPYDKDVLIERNLETVVDFDTLDFYLPLVLLFVIFALQFFLSQFYILMLQLLLLRDLIRRVQRRPSGKKAAGLVAPYGRYGWGWSVAAYAAAAPVIFAAGWLNRYLYGMVFGRPFMMADASPVESLASAGLGSAPPIGILILVILLTVVLAPVTEELWFRGIGLAGFMRKSGSPASAVFWTSVIFGLLHGPSRVLFTTAFGFLLGLIRFRTGSTHCCIAIHALHNGLVVAYAVITYM